MALDLNQQTSARDTSGAEVQAFLRFFSSLPLLQSKPSAVTRNEPQALRAAAPSKMVLACSQPAAFYAAVGEVSVDQVLKEFPYLPTAWEWDWTDVADASRIPDTNLYDPVAAYMALRCKRLLFQVSHAEDATRLLTWLVSQRKQDESRFFEAMAIVLSQQYYVTSRCDDCLTAARLGLPMLRDAVEEYSLEELDHHILIQRSIEEVSEVPPHAYQYMPEVRMEIDVIRWAAEQCPLSFSALVSIMEGTVYPESDPVGDLLKDSSRPRAREGVEAHFQINKRGNHTAIPERFVSCLPPVDVDMIRVATRLTEATVRLDAGLARSLLASFQS